MLNDAREIRESSSVRLASTREITPNADSDQLRWIFPGQVTGPARWDLTRWSARQLCAFTGVPFDFASWEATQGQAGVQLLAANFLLALRLKEERKVLTYLHSDGAKVMAFNGPDYGRVYNSTVLEKVKEKFDNSPEWTLPYNAAEDIKAALARRKYGLTMSEHDMYVFMIHGESLRVFDRNYYRGIAIWNSEVGAKSLGMSQFLYAEGCANRLVLTGVFGVEMRIIHRLSAPERFLSEGVDILHQLAHSDPGPAIAALHAAREKKVAVDRKSAVDFLRANGLGKMVAENAADIGAAQNGGDYTTLLSLIDGVTRNSQRTGFTDQRMEEDTLAGKLLSKYAA